MLIRRLTAITLLFAMFLVSSTPLCAQTASDDWSRVNALEANTKVSVKLKTGKSIKGRVNSVSESGISLRVSNATQEVKREEIQSVYRFSSRSATKATLIGMGVGAGLGAITGAVGSRESDFDKLDQAVTAGLTILGAGVGAAVGYLIGRSGSKKELIYNAR